jgi:hypothetical protein
MGAWGYGNLENDSVLDWLVELLETDDLSLISEAIEMVLDDSYLDADTASIGLGAIEILGALLCKPGKEEYDDELVEWINQHKGQGSQLLESTKLALIKILKNSELKELWQESKLYEDWVKTIKELEVRITL